jgi:outer membrane protein assembly factor BamB
VKNAHVQGQRGRDDSGVRTLRHAVPLALLLSFAVTPSAAVAASRDPEGVLVAIDMDRGAVRWQVPTPGELGVIDVSPGVVIGRQFACDSSAFRTVAYDKHGERLWSRPAARDNEVRGTDTLATGARRSGVAVSLPTSKSVVGVGARTGATRWSQAFQYDPFVSGNRNVVVATSTEGEYPESRSVVRAVDRATGRQLWSVTDDGQDRRLQALVDGRSVALTAQDAHGRALEARVVEPRSGEVRWRVAPGELLFPAGSVVLAFGSGPERMVRALDADRGTQLWSRPGSSFAVSYGARIALQVGEGYDTAVVDARTGKELWHIAQPERVVGDASTMAVSDGRTVTVVDPDTGVARGRSISLPEGYDTVHSLVFAGDTLYASLGCVPLD